MYATVDEIERRCRRTLSDTERTLCESLLEDAAVIVDSYGKNAPENSKKLVSCNMVVRALGSGTDDQVPIGASQGTVSALGYSQTWSLGSGSTGELYLTKLDKKLLGVGCKINFSNPFEEIISEDNQAEAEAPDVEEVIL